MGEGSVELERKLMETKVKRLERFLEKKNRQIDKKSKPIVLWESIWRDLRDSGFNFDSLYEPAAPVLYLLARIFKPRIVLETGVKFGFSSTFILKALNTNGLGTLISVDEPNVAYYVRDSSSGVFSYLNDLLPAGFETGCLIPDSLRKKWRLVVGRTQTHLPAILKELETVDLFFRDSQHTYDAMQFEFEQTYPYLAPGGILVSDNIDLNSAFDEFAARVLGKVYRISYVGISMRP